jgi:hypothetical protein
MRRKLGNTLIVSFLLMTCIPALAAIAEASNNVSGDVKVRIWDRARLGSEAWGHAKAAIDGVFNPIGIKLIWLHCAIDDTPENLACSSPTGSNDISLRIYRRTKADFKIKGHSTGGFSLLLSPEGGQGIIHVFFDRVTEVSQIHRVPLELVLGITVAHEIGHLLLPHQPHALAGIMRAKLDSKDWRLAAQGSLGFADRQMQIISAGVEARSLKPLTG